MKLQIIPKQEVIPEFDSQSIAIKHIEGRDIDYEGAEITEEVIAEILKQIPLGIEVILSLDPDGEDDWMEVICDGTWLALGFCGDSGQDNYYCYNAAYSGTEDICPLVSEGQSLIKKSLALQDIETGIKAVEYFMRTGGFYPGIDWAHQLE